MKQKWCIEYSFAKNTFDTLPLDQVLKINLENFNNGIQTDFMPLWLFETKEAADYFIDQIKDTVYKSVLFIDLNDNLCVKEKSV
jgi:hypothetical protein